MERIGVTIVWAAPDGRYIGALGDGVRSPVLIAEMNGEGKVSEDSTGGA